MKFLKGMFPGGKKAVGMVLLTVAGVLVYNVINRKFNVEGKISRSIPVGSDSNMKAA